MARSALRAPVSAAPSQPLQITNGFEQPPKPGGLEITNGFEPANPAPGALQITNGFDTPAALQATGAGVQSAASALGVPPGPAAQMARGFPMPEGFANGGMVRGPGTGTSDSVKDAVPPGTYIMPADSTRQIGEQNMAGLGFRPGMMQAAQAASPGPGLGFKSRSQREKEQAARLSAKRMREDRARDAARSASLARMQSERAAAERENAMMMCADAMRRYGDAKNRQIPPHQIQPLKRAAHAACGAFPDVDEAPSDQNTADIPPPTSAPSVITNCDASGCWDNMGGRYNRGAGQTYFPAQGGAACQMVGGAMRCP